MKDRPVICSAPMVRALLERRKTMTRRLAWRMDCGKRVEWSPTPWQRVQPGDRLWVRENFSGPHEWETIPPSGWGWDTMRRPPIWYWADGNPEQGDWTKPRPSIHMPRWASRLTLDVTATKIERVQKISHDDAVAEGVGIFPHSMSAQKRFSELWRSLHGAPSWDENPEVVAVTFTVHKANIDAMPREAAA